MPRFFSPAALRLSLSLIGSLALAAVLAGCAPLSSGSSGASPDEGREPDTVRVVILHTNDTHAFAAGLDARGRACVEDAACFGGYARLAAAIARERASGEHVIALDAGDAWQGTLFFRAEGWRMPAEIWNSIGWDAVTLGNHEFDLGCSEARAYLDALAVPVLAANLEPSACPASASPHRQEMLIRDAGGIRIGIFGLMNDEVRTISGACPDTAFRPREAAAREAAAHLRAQGAQIVIALTHLGYPEDQALAAAVDGIDIIAGGHSHDLLGSSPKAAGPYPTWVTTPSGGRTAVVTAKRSAEYLGRLELTLTREGRIIDARGGAIRLTPDFPRDAAVEKRVEAWAKDVRAIASEPIAVNRIDYPDGLDPCREGDCLSGRLTAEAFLDWGRRWGAQAALINGGAIRESLPEGNVTHGDILAMHPFGGSAAMRDMTGAELLAALEHGASANPDFIGPELLQTAGLIYRADPQAPAGRRVTGAALVAHGREEPIDPARTYRIVTNDYLARGGDGFSMIAGARPITCGEASDAAIVESYLRRLGEVPAPEGKHIILPERKRAPLPAED